MVRKFPPFRSEREKRTTSGGSLQFPNGFSGKLLFHLTYNRNFRILWLNGKHPRFRSHKTSEEEETCVASAIPKSKKPEEKVVSQVSAILGPVYKQGCISNRELNKESR